MAENKRDKAMRQETLNILTRGCTYDGVVFGVDPIGRYYSLKLDAGQMVHNVPFAAGALGHALSFNEKFIVPLGTGVKYFHTNKPSFITDSSQDLPDMANPKASSVMGGGEPTDIYSRQLGETLSKKRPYKVTTPYAADQYEGEWSMDNTLGIAINLMTTVAKLTAADRARFEALLLKDMARVVAKNFGMITDWGDIEIINNGRLTAVINGCSYEHEAWGVLDPKDEKVEIKNGKIQFDKIDTMLDTARWRFSQYIGWLGNFIHTMVTDPTDVLGKISEDAVRSGKNAHYVLNDGSDITLSVADIVMEVRSRIVVPIPLKRWEDCSTMKAEDFDLLDQKWLKLWQLPPDPKDMFKSAYQLREYALWLVEFHALCRFHQMADKGMWKVPKASETPAPEYTNKEKDVKEANANAPYLHRDTYSTIRIMRDGTQVLYNTDGNQIIMSPQGMHLSSIKNIRIESAGDLILIAGGSIFMKAFRHIEMSAIRGGLIMKARSWIRSLCERGSIWIKSDAVALGTTPPAKDSPTDPDPQILAAGIVLNTSQSGIMIDGMDRVSVIGSRPPANSTDTRGSVEILSRFNGVSVGATKDVSIVTNAKIKMKAATEILTSCINWFAKVPGKFDVNRQFTVSSATTSIGMLYANSGWFKKNIFGPKTGFTEATGPGNLKRHFNHIGINKTGEGPKLATASDVADLTAFVKVAEKEKSALVQSRTEATFWTFMVPAEYTKEGDVIYEALPQQDLRLELPATYTTWTWDSDDITKAALGTGSTRPWPGTDMKVSRTDGGVKLSVPSSKDYATLATQTPLKESKPTTFCARK